MKRLSIVHGLGATLLLVVFCTPLLSQFSAWQKRLNGVGEAVGINPLNPNTIYAQDASHYLVVSRNQGKTWSTVYMAVPWQIREIIVHPNDTLTLFITDFFNGLWRSTNAGASWTTVISPYGIDGESVTYDPMHPDTMYAGAFSDGALHRSTDRGASWTQMGLINSNLCALAVRPDSSNILLAGSGAGTISKSTDSGVHWHQVKSAGSTEIPKIVINRSSPQIAYATAFSGDPSVLGVWKTTNGGENWFRTALQGINVWALDIDQTAPNTLYAGTFSEYNAGVYKTTDGGSTWQFFGKGFVPYNSMWNFHIDPLNTANVYMAATIGDFGDDGLYKLMNADAGIEGTVRDSLTNNPITSGQIVIQPPGNSLDLSENSGRFSFYRFDGDTVTTHTFSVYINASLFKQENISLIADSMMPKDILVSPGSIRGNVFNDLNNNGARDLGEPGIPGWTMLLSGPGSATRVADVNGDYVFTDLFPGTYTVSEQSRNGWVQTFPNPATYSVSISLALKDVTGKDFGNHRRHGVASVSPVPYSGSSLANVTIQAVFDTAVTLASLKDTSSFIVSGKRSGRHRGAFTSNPANTTITFSPAVPFQPGEDVAVDITTNVTNANGQPVSPFNFVFSVAADSGPGTFVGRLNVQVGSGPFSIGVGDVDGDGDNDIITANYNGNTISVLRNNGFGTFSPKVDYATGPGPTSLALVDVDLDGDLDVVALNNGNSTLSVLKNNGNGSFAAKVDYGVAFSPFTVDVADLNGDGYPDLVVVGPSSSLLSVLINNKSGGFPTHQNYTAGGVPWSVALGDVDNDGTVDAVSLSAGSPSSFSVLGNLGDGTYGAPTSYSVGTNAHANTITDVTGDNEPDVIATNSGSNSISIYPKSGTIFGPRSDVATGTGPWGVAAGDLDGDGRKDIVVADLTMKMITVLKNLGAGSYARTDYDAGLSPRAVAVADLDGDGDMDVVAANSGSDSVSLYINSDAATVSYVAGWNLISLPVVPRDLQKISAYPTATSNAFAYAGSYIVQDTLKFGIGYWMKFSGPGNTFLRGDQVALDSIDLRAQWNMVGALSTQMSTAGVATVPGGIITSNFYAYDGAYHVVDSLAPGKGFWIKTSQAGKLVLASSVNQPLSKAGGLPSSLEECSSLDIRDAAGNRQTLYFTSDAALISNLDRYELPPVPPGARFDARFGSGRILEGTKENDTKAFPLKLSGAEYPVRLSWNVRAAEREWRLVAGHEQRLLRDAGSMLLHSPASVVLNAARGNDAELPQSYSLAQNFPNPFNPSTEIRYGLPDNSLVQIRILNVLGQEVARLVDGEQTAGFHMIMWRPDVGSGLYFYELRAVSKEHPGISFSDLKKMILVK